MITGLDFQGMASIGQKLAEHEDVARRCKILKEMIVAYQASISSLEKVYYIGLVINYC